MTNCKSCMHYEVCKKKIDDWDTYRICNEYWGTCENCLHNQRIVIVNLCAETACRCDNIISCGLWEERMTTEQDEE